MLKGNWKIDPSMYLVPVEIARFIFQRRQWRMMQVYLLLKAHCRGQLRMTNELQEGIRDIIGVKSVETVRRSIAKLLQLNWIGFNPVSEIYFIRGFDNILKQIGGSNRRGYWFPIIRIRQMQGFVIATILSEMIVWQRMKSRGEIGTKSAREAMRIAKQIGGKIATERPVVQLRWSTKQTGLPTFFPIANEAFAKIANISMPTASKYKALAVNSGFINRKRSRSKLQWTVEKTRELLKKRNVLRKEGVHVVFHNGRYAQNLPDLLKTNLNSKKRRNGR